MKAFKTRIYPTKEQATMIDKTIGCCRFVYNQGLAFKKTQFEENGVSISAYELIKRLPEQKKELEWLKEVDSQALQQSLLDLQSAYSKFFKEKKGFPSFHKKGQKDSFRAMNVVRESAQYLKLPKIGAVKSAEKIKKKWNIHNATISKRAGQYFVSLLIDYTQPIKKCNSEQVGIDVGIKTFAVLSSGKEYDNPKTLKKYEERLAVLQRRLSHTVKGSNNRRKAKERVARLHLKVANIRKDFLHKTSSEIVNQYSYIAVENLNISGMVKNHTLAKSILDCSWGEFVSQLDYKSKVNGCELHKIGRFEASSKKCSECGYKMAEMPLRIRDWTCPNCNKRHNRDKNASVNILNISLSDREVEPVDTCHSSGIEQENLVVV